LEGGEDGSSCWNTWVGRKETLLNYELVENLEGGHCIGFLGVKVKKTITNPLPLMGFTFFQFQSRLLGEDEHIYISSWLDL